MIHFITLLLIPLYTVTFAQPIVDLGNDTTVCQNPRFFLHAPKGHVSYLWQNSTTFDSIWTFAAGTYSVTVTDSNGDSASDTINIKFHPWPVTGWPEDTSMCNGDSIWLNAGCCFLQYLWNDGSIDPNRLITSAGIYGVEIVDTNTCEGADKIEVYSWPYPEGQLDDTTFLCEGSTVNLDAGGIQMTYLWSDSQTTKVITVDSAWEYSVVLTSLHDCVGYDTTLVIGMPGPSVDIGNDTAFCNGGSATFDAGAGFNQYNWSTGGNGQSITVTMNGDYSVFVWDSNDCVASDTAAVVIYALPTVNLGPDTTICGGTIITLDAGPDPVSYLWSDSSTNQTLDVSSADKHFVTVMNSDGCERADTLELTLELCEGINEAAGNDISIYPNPAQNVVVVKSDIKLIRIVISDLLGRRMLLENPNNLKTSISLRDLNPGAYLIQTFTRDAVQHRMLVVE